MRFILLCGWFALLLPAAEERVRLEVGHASNDMGRSANCLWEAKSGRCYFVQWTEDLSAMWNYAPVAIMGSGVTESAMIPGYHHRCFVRLVHVECEDGDPMEMDFDGDRVPNGVELLADPQLDPLDGGDRDGDTLPDDWERYHFGSENLHSGGADPDGDAAGNLEEFEVGGDPTRPDHPQVPLVVYYVSD